MASRRQTPPRRRSALTHRPPAGFVALMAPVFWPAPFVVPPDLDVVRYVPHVIGRGIALYQSACEADAEGIVAKWRRAPYRPLDGGPSWLKIKNPSYTQARDRHELFDRRHAR